MMRSSALVERPVLRLLLLALMGLALASRLALGATLPVAGAEDGAAATEPLAELRAAMIMCHPGHGPQPSPALPHGPLLSDLLLFDQADNTYALGSNPIAASPPVLQGSAVEFVAVYAASRPYLWRAARPGPWTTGQDLNAACAEARNRIVSVGRRAGERGLVLARG